MTSALVARARRLERLRRAELLAERRVLRAAPEHPGVAPDPTAPSAADDRNRVESCRTRHVA